MLRYLLSLFHIVSYPKCRECGKNAASNDACQTCVNLRPYVKREKNAH